MWKKSLKTKYSNKLSMKALVGKSMLMKNKKNRGTSLNIPFFTFISLKLKGTQGHSKNSKDLICTHLSPKNLRELIWTHLHPNNSRELKETQGNSSELIWTQRTQGNSRLLKGSARRCNGRKKTQKKGQRINFENLRRKEKT